MALERAGLPSSGLVVEVTESILMRTSGPGHRTLSSLRERGVRVAIDDFGTGFSSMSYLHRLPVDMIKIDRTFVSPELEMARSEAVLEAIVGLAHNLNLDLVAEGIETADQLARLILLGCPVGQGFLFSRPLPPEALEAYVGRSIPDPGHLSHARRGEGNRSGSVVAGAIRAGAFDTDELDLTKTSERRHSSI